MSVLSSQQKIFRSELLQLGSLFTRTQGGCVVSCTLQSSRGLNCWDATKAFHPEQSAHSSRYLPQAEPKKNEVQNIFMSDTYFFSSDLICANCDSTLETDLRNKPEKSQFWILTISLQKSLPTWRGSIRDLGVGIILKIHSGHFVCLQGSLNFWRKTQPPWWCLSLSTGKNEHHFTPTWLGF